MSEEQLKETISLLRSGKLKQAGKNARTFAAKHFDWSMAFDRMTSYYAEILSTGGEGLADEPRRWTP